MPQPTKRDSILPPSLPIQSTSKFNLDSSSSTTSIILTTTTTTSFQPSQITPFYNRIISPRIYLEQQVIGKEVDSNYSIESSNNNDDDIVDKINLSGSKGSDGTLSKRQDAAGCKLYFLYLF